MSVGDDSVLIVEGLLTFLIHSLALMDCLDPESASSYKMALTTVTPSQDTQAKNVFFTGQVQAS